VVVFLKTLVILLLAVVVFGGGGFATYWLFIKPDVDLQREMESPSAARPAFEDTTLPEYQKCLAVEAAGDLLASRRSFLDFVESYPDAPSAEDARFRIGRIQAELLFAPRMTPEKQSYVVKAGDGIQRITQRLKCPTDLFLALNPLESTALKVGQKLMYMPHEFTVEVDRKASKVLVLWRKEFFGQYRITETQGAVLLGGSVKKGTAPVTVKVMDKPGWVEGKRVSGSEAATAGTHRWIVFQSSAHTLYGVDPSSEAALQKPNSGYGLPPEAIRLLAAVLSKNDLVVIR
jgi:hypothetical protein